MEKPSSVNSIPLLGCAAAEFVTMSGIVTADALTGICAPIIGEDPTTITPVINAAKILFNFIVVSCLLLIHFVFE